MKTSMLVYAFLGLMLSVGIGLGAYFVVAVDEDAPDAISLIEEPEAETESETETETETEADPEPELPEITEEGENPTIGNEGGTDPSHIANTDLDGPSPEPSDSPVEVESEPGEVASPSGTTDLREALKELKEGGDLGNLEDLVKKLKESGAEGIDIGGIFSGEQVQFTATVSGTVVDGSGTPVAEAAIYVDITESSGGGGTTIMIMRTGLGSKITTTDAAGNWTAEISRTVAEKAKIEATFKAKATGYAESKGYKVTLKNEDVKSGVKLTMRGAGSVSGRVLDEGGRGVEGVTVTLSSKDTSRWGGGFSYTIPGQGQSGKTDTGGNYSIEDVPEGRYSLSIKAPGYRKKSGPTEVDVKVGEITRIESDFTLGVTTSLRVTLVNTGGEAIQGYLTITILEGDGESDRKLFSRADKNGLVILSDPPVGTFEVEIKVWGYTTETRTITFNEGRATDIGKIMLQKDKNAGGWGED